MAYLNSNIPTFFAYLKSEFLYNDEPHTPFLMEVEVFGVTSLSRRCLLFEVMSSYGSRHSRVPIHYLVLDEKHTNYPLDWLQLWDCYSNNISVTRYEYHKNSQVHVQLKDRTFAKGKYLFTIDSHDNPDAAYGYSEIAAGHKCHHIIAGEGGQIFAQPNNRVRWTDGGAFITKKLEKPDWQVFCQEFTCEGAGKWIAEDNYDLFYQFKPVTDTVSDINDSLTSHGTDGKMGISIDGKDYVNALVPPTTVSAEPLDELGGKTGVTIGGKDFNMSLSKIKHYMSGFKI
jgi:hypothetical protein